MRIFLLLLLFFSPLISEEPPSKTGEPPGVETASQASSQGIKVANHNWATWGYASLAVSVAVAGLIATAVDTGSAAHS